MSAPIITFAIGIALGAAVVLDANRLHPVACVPDPVPAVRPVREPMMLSSPLACEHGWVKNCADWGACVEACL